MPAATYDALAAKLQLTPAHATAWRTTFDESTPTFPSPDYAATDPARMSAVCTLLALPHDTTAALTRAASLLAANEPLHRLAHHCHHLLTVRHVIWPGWTPLPAHLGPLAEMFYALVYAAAFTHLLSEHARRHIPLDVTRATAADLDLWMRDHLNKTGRWGLAETNWLSVHTSGNLVALGRLQFEIHPWETPFEVYADHHGQIITLAPDNTPFRPDGQFADADRATHPTPWTARLTKTPATITGYPVHDGAVSRTPVTLHHPTRLVAPGDHVITVHIPATGPLSPDLCDASLARAERDIPRWFPEYKLPAYTCVSWLMDPALRHVLPPDSNILHFQRRFEPLPFPAATADQTMERVFGAATIDPATAPAKTSLQRAVLRELRAGRRFRMYAAYLSRPLR